MAESVHCEVDAAGIARITLDEPNSRANTLHRAVWEQLGEACRNLHHRSGVNGLIIHSAKPGIFIAGADLREIADLPIDDPEPTRALVRRGRDVLAALEALPFPTVAVIDGAALGGGFEVALACDCRLAGSNPKFKVGLPEVKLGLIPGWGGTQRPSRLFGEDTAIHLVCTGVTHSAEEASLRRLIDTVVASADLDSAAVDRIAAMRESESWRAIRARKHKPAIDIDCGGEYDSFPSVLETEQQPAGREALRVVTQGARLPLHEALAIEEAAFVPLVASDNARKLIATFLRR